MENRQIVVFKLMGHEFGIAIEKVLEILNYEWIRPVPAVPNYVEGIINVRGTVYPIFSLRKRLNMSGSEDVDSAKFILLHLKENKVGFMVDSVEEILTVDPSRVESSPKMLDKNRVNCIDYIVKKDNAMIIVLDVNQLISDKDNLYIQGVSDEEDYSSNAK